MQPQFFRRLVLQVMAGALVLGAAATSTAQTAPFPNKPLRILVPFTAGSGSDIYARFFGKKLSEILGQPVIVENKPGAGGALAVQALKADPADGYTILLASNSVMAVNPIVMKDLPYDPFKDFRPVHGLFVSGAVLVASPENPSKSVAELVGAVKQAKRPMSIGNYSEGYQLLGTWLGHVAQVPITPVPYKGGGAMVTDVLGGRLDAGFNDASGVMQMVNTGKLRGLAITSAKRDPKLPDVPTMKELGFANFESYVWASFYVRSGTPDAVTQTLADAMSEALNSPESKARAAARPGELLNLSMSRMGEFQRDEYERFKKVAAAAGLQPR